MAAVQVGKERMGGAEAGVVVLLSAECGGTRRGPGRAWSPRFDLDRAVHVHDVNGGRALGREGRPPCFAVMQAQRSAVTDRPDRQGEVERPAELESRAYRHVHLTRLSEPRR